MPSHHRLPPLNSLRVFEAAARHQSLSRAAEELCVTHSAVSRHVAKLEDHLNTKLFERRHQQVVLTSRGAAYARRLNELFRQIQEETAAHFYGEPQERLLRIGVLSTFAMRFLIPRLARFRARWPDVTLKVESAKTPASPVNPDIDVAILLGKCDAAGAVAEHLFDEELVPVASAALLAGHRVRVADDLAPFLLLHAEHRADDWPMWLREMGATRVDGHSGLKLDYSGLVYQAAVDGLGIAMAQTKFVQEDTARGLLVRVIDRPVRSGRSYCVAYAQAKAGEPRIANFVAWLKEEVAAGTMVAGAGERRRDTCVVT
jgi:LysR family transcriptional regulator, glycine cleavage system transcriptional activator